MNIKKKRLYLIVVFLSLSMMGLVWKLYDLQLGSYETFVKLADSQHSSVYEVQPRRGAIFDSFMDVLAINIKSMSLFADPNFIEDMGKTAASLAPILDMDFEDLKAKLERDTAFVWLKRKASETTLEKVKELDLKGIYSLDESRRTYPNGDLASHLLGFAGIDNQGLSGLELYYDEELRGKKGWRHFLRDAHRRSIAYDEELSVSAEDGFNLVLTIDSIIQYITEKELKKMVEEFNPERATIIVSEPYTGRILALANYPNFDPNFFSSAPSTHWQNPAVSSVHEPGSVFKIVAAAAALEEEVFSLDDIIYCEMGQYYVGGRILNDFYNLGDLSFKDVFARSSNIGTVKIAKKTGEEKLYEYIRDFGFGEKTGIDLPGEVRGIVRPPAVWSRSDITTIPIGQGIAVTPVQLAAAFGAIANGGFLMEPYLVERIITSDGHIKEQYNPNKKKRVISKQTSDKMKEVLSRAVESGTGTRAKSEEYAICGKTGTAQIASPGGGYYENKYRASFAGFVPIEHPALTIVVTAEDPKPIYFGGTVAAPTFKNISEQVMQYLTSAKTGRALNFQK